MDVSFQCVKECSQCCTKREYYPSVEFGKIGVLILPKELDKIKKLADTLDIPITILPRIGASDDNTTIEILAHQLMGIEENGDTCPFLDTTSDKRSPHGGYTCKIYDSRPLACRAYPVIESKPLTLDSKCKFYQECGCANTNLDSELESLIQIKTTVKTSKGKIWRYATAIGEIQDKSQFKSGWIPLS